MRECLWKNEIRFHFNRIKTSKIVITTAHVGHPENSALVDDYSARPPLSGGEGDVYWRGAAASASLTSFCSCS